MTTAQLNTLKFMKRNRGRSERPAGTRDAGPRAANWDRTMRVLKAAGYVTVSAGVGTGRGATAFLTEAGEEAMASASGWERDEARANGQPADWEVG